VHLRKQLNCNCSYKSLWLRASAKWLTSKCNRVPFEKQCAILDAGCHLGLILRPSLSRNRERECGIRSPHGNHTVAALLPSLWPSLMWWQSPTGIIRTQSTLPCLPPTKPHHFIYSSLSISDRWAPNPQLLPLLTNLLLDPNLSFIHVLCLTHTLTCLMLWLI
jgi:hypothetical protein